MHRRRIARRLQLLAIVLVIVFLAIASCRHAVHSAAHNANLSSKGGLKTMTDDHATTAAAAADGAEQTASAAAAAGAAPQTHALGDALRTLEVDIANGTLDIQSAPAGAPAQATWTVERSGALNAAAPETLQLLFDAQPNGTLKVHDTYTGPKTLNAPQIHLTLALPASIPVDAALGNGKLSIDSNARLSASVGNGTLTLAGNYPDSDLSVGNGEVKGDVQFSAGKHELSVGNGSVDLALRDGSRLSYTVGTGIGGIQLAGVPGKIERALVSQTASGTLGEAAAGAAKLDISVGNGSVKLRNGADANNRVAGAVSS